ncbi:ATP-binding cassette domain-containing protein [Bifidobacterium aerophilum]|uniref:ATP-binding cassette domain-containing protein n=1 Tax=Bifidobacterium aerophilum TaxID=1798155 RepID=A0A6N9Z433_9BIFI|nr:ATP-binding cassette domain-containing protein [Bifidobacterium aerophilum]NEG88943.1 ATP-binding cassette domain-containing protein [Bifidobacterium aerophilum]
MFDKRLFRMAPGIGRLVAGKVACMWVSLLANIGFVLALVSLLGSLMEAVIPGRTGCGVQIADVATATGTTGCAANLFGLTDVTLSTRSIATYAAVFVVCAIVRYAMTRIAAGLGTEAAERVKLGLRESLYRKMLRLGPSYATRVKTSDIVQSAGEGVEQIQSFFELFLPQLFYAILAPVTLFAVLAPVNMPTAVTLLVCAPLIVLIVGLVAMSAARMFKKYWGSYTDMGATFLDDMQGLETLKIFDADERAARDMDEKAERFRVMTMRVLQIQLRSLSSMDLVAYGGTAAGIGVALWQYAVGGPAAPSLAGVLLVVLLSADFFIPLRQLGSYFHVAMNGMTSTKRIFRLLDAPEPRQGDVALADTGRFAPVVAFEQTGFSYHGADDQSSERDEKALENVTFMANPGHVTAIVGVSGSGKSTAAALLSGTLTGYTGSIALLDMRGKHEIRDIDTDSLTRTVTMVGARSHLFAGTLRDNLAMAYRGPAGESADHAMWDALRCARIDDFVREQPGGLDMTIEPDAANLSGGQRQRIAIARALLHDSPVIVFDEATSSVDVESETLILDTIRDLAKAGKTVIMITHRLANAERADMIVVFDHGNVVQSGMHRGLIGVDGEYARLYRAQRAIEQVGRRSGSTGFALPEGETGTQTERNSDFHMAAPPEGGAGRRSRTEGVNEVLADGAGTPSVSFADSSPSKGEQADGPSKGALTDGLPKGEREADAADKEAESAKAVVTSQGRLGAVIARLLRIARPLTSVMTLASVAGTIGHLAATLLPVFGMFAAFALAGHPVWGVGVVPAVVAMIVCAVLRGVMRYVEQYSNHNVAFRLLALFRSRAFAALRRLAPAKLAGKGKGDLIALITTDVELLEIFFAHTISPVVIAVVTTVVYALVLLALSPAMALLLVVSHLIIGVVVPRFFAVNVQSLGPVIRRQASDLDNVMLDDMRGLREIIGFGRGEERAANIVERTRALWKEHARLSRVNGGFAGIGMVLVMALTVAAAALAVRLGLGDPQDAPALVIAFVLFASSFGPTLALSALPANLTQTFAAARRLFALMDETPAVDETGTAAPAYDGMGLEHVTFAYPTGGERSGRGSLLTPSVSSADSSPYQGEQGKLVLDDVSMAVPRSGILGIQGPSGRGKSTLLKLLMRYWDPQSGAVTFSGEPLPRIDAAYRRRVQTMMSQETALFDGTIRDNLLIALPDDIRDAANGRNDNVQGGNVGNGSDDNGSCRTAIGKSIDDRLRDACRKASVLDLIDSLPAGLDTPVGELGDRLSEGERQRIGLARIFLRDADLVLFDEPTSRLDALNEAVILQSINALAVRTDAAIMLVSHRESAMRIADTVVRM